MAVYQVKSFSSNMTAGQKAQVERSFRRILDYAKGRSLQMTEWYLMLPLDRPHSRQPRRSHPHQPHAGHRPIVGPTLVLWPHQRPDDGGRPGGKNPINGPTMG